MSDITPETPNPTDGNEEPKETDWKAEARKWEARAKDSLKEATANKSAAERLAQIEAENQTEAEKAAARAEAAEKRAAELELRSIRAEVANAKGVPGSLLSGATQEELEASADALIEFRGEQKNVPKADPSQGPSDAAAPRTPAQEFAALFN